jgi:hypothetical protein
MRGGGAHVRTRSWTSQPPSSSVSRTTKSTAQHSAAAARATRARSLAVQEVQQLCSSSGKQTCRYRRQAPDSTHPRWIPITPRASCMPGSLSAGMPPAIGTAVITVPRRNHPPGLRRIQLGIIPFAQEDNGAAAHFGPPPLHQAACVNCCDDSAISFEPSKMPYSASTPSRHRYSG